MVPSRLEFKQPMRREMQKSADRARDGLRLVMIIEAGEITPAGVSAQFDQASAKHDAKPEPAKKPDHQDGRPRLWEGPGIEQRTKKDRQESGLKQLDFPAIAVPNLTDVNDRHVHCPKDCEQD